MPPSSAPGRRVRPKPAASAFGKAWRRRTWRQIRGVFFKLEMWLEVFSVLSLGGFGWRDRVDEGNPAPVDR